MAYIKRFEELSKGDTNIAGGKGASLGELTRAGIPVPPGFVVRTSAFERFLDETDLRQEVEAELGKVDPEVVHTAERASEQLQSLVISAEMPSDIKNEIEDAFKVLGAEYVAVRSSATAEDGAENAWAGQLDSYLNTTQSTLLVNVQKCWASLFTPRAIVYRIEKGLHESHVSVAVVVQKMVESESSGIAFSVHPVTEAPNQLIIEAGWGLGEAIVSGSITPDSYVVEKEKRAVAKNATTDAEESNVQKKHIAKPYEATVSKTETVASMKIIDKNIAEQTRGIFRNPSTSSGQEPNEWRDIPAEKGSRQVLSDEDILELSELILKIERHYGFPVDVEWARDVAGKFYIVQSRPITTLGRAQVTVDDVSSISDVCSEYQEEVVTPFKKIDYVLTFWAKGVSVLVADINSASYRALEILSIIDNGLFKQYFARHAYEQALQEGLAFYSDPDAYTTYHAGLVENIEALKAFYAHHISSKKSLTREQVQEFFRHACTLLTEYNRMNSEYTDLAFAQQDQNDVIRRNLEGVAQFKDVVRTFINTVFFEEDGYTSRMIEILGKQFHLDPALLYQLTQQEVLALFEDKNINETVVFLRQHAFVLNYTQEIFEGVTAESILEEFNERVTQSRTFEGQTANRGKARGKVKVISADYGNLSNLHAEIEIMEVGDILVAETTAPELLLACKKAAAIVTDIGGLMSHAAIISRELKKPCVIGTKIATQVLHDGDLVEVDADQGVVRVLERAQTNMDRHNSTLRIGDVRAEDYVLSFQATGVSLFVADIFNRYGEFDYLVFSQDGKYRIMIRNDRDRLRALFEKYYTNNQEAERGVEKAQRHIRELHALASILGHADAIDAAQFDTFLEHAYAFFHEYAKFDVCITDHFFTAEAKDTLTTKVQQKIQTVEEHKNVLREQQNSVFFADTCVFGIVTRLLSTTLGIAEPELNNLTVEEIQAFLRGGDIVSRGPNPIDFAIVRHGDARSYYFGTDVVELAQSLLWEPGSQIKELHGIPVQQGIVTGNVRKVTANYHKLASSGTTDGKGYVLVTEMTIPEMLPAIQQAVAVVTDIGGMLSHAAITSRELRIPCIVGVKGATQVLHDGDLVEVDAERGVVTILERATPGSTDTDT